MGQPIQVRSSALEDGFYMHISDLIDMCTAVMDVASEEERRGAARIAGKPVDLANGTQSARLRPSANRIICRRIDDITKEKRHGARRNPAS
jgi:hypothetical protein